ncbi:MAG TPA: DUF3179 domain-containing protein [candidate division Zixibacteria bacterium]|nr:DUF3179 domain-containing protein [candidate division Zixibacteria bacterium]
MIIFFNCRAAKLTIDLVLLILILTVCSDISMAQRPKPKETEIKGHTMYTLLKPGDIPAIFKPEFISISEADEYYYPDEPLIVVVDGEEARAYSTWHLDHHEIVNDYINGKSITVTW